MGLPHRQPNRTPAEPPSWETSLPCQTGKRILGRQTWTKTYCAITVSSFRYFWTTSFVVDSFTLVARLRWWDFREPPVSSPSTRVPCLLGKHVTQPQPWDRVCCMSLPFLTAHRSVVCSSMLRGPVSALLNPSAEERKPCLCHRISSMKLISPPISGSRLPPLRCPQCAVYQTVPGRSCVAHVWYFKTFCCFETLPFEGWCAMATLPDYESSLRSVDWQCANPDKFLPTPSCPLTSCLTYEFLCAYTMHVCGS